MNRLRPRGYLLLEILLCIAILALISGVLAATIASLRESMHVRIQREVTAEIWSDFSRQLRDDLKRARSLHWRGRMFSSAGGGGAPVQAKVLWSVALPDDLEAVYVYAPGLVERRVFKKGAQTEHRIFALDVQASSLKHAPPPKSEGSTFWMLQAVAEPVQGQLVTLRRPDFFQIACEVRLMGGERHTFITGSATRTDEGSVP